MPSIDERIVSAAFENAKFEAAVAVTMATLAKLDKSFQEIGKTNSFADIEKAASKVTLDQPMSVLDKLKTRLFGASQGADEGLGGIERAGNKITLDAPMTALDKLQAKTGQVGANAADGFSQIEKASAKVELSGLTSALDSVTAKFSVLQGAASVALGNIASQAALRGAAFAKSFSLGPVQAGLQEYTTNLNSIQTILANTATSGGNLQTVNAALDDLNHYSDKTIYNFGEMAKNIGTFTAAGVHLDTATQSIKGIANLAALSGSNSQQASTAMYQLSQAIAAGKVNLQDWNSVVNAGMGGEVFQKALFDTGKAMHTITNSPVGQTFEEWKKAGNSFRQSLSATQKAAQDGTSQLAKTQKDAAKSVADAHEASSEAIANAAERVKDTQKSSAEAIANAAERVKTAQEAQTEAVTNAAKRVTEAQKAQADAAKASADKVKEAQKGVSDTSKQATTDVKAAQQAQIDAFAQNAEDVQQALEGVIAARKRLVEAMKPPSADELQAAADNLKTAQLDQADLSTAVTDAQTEQKRSAEDLAAAQKKLADLKAKGDASPEEILSASRAVEDAQKRQKDSSDAVERALLRQNAATRDLHQAQTDLQETQKKGSDQDQNVIDAQDALSIAIAKQTAAQTKAANDNIEAQKQINKVRLDGIAAVKEANKRLDEAEAQRTETLKKGREAVVQAEKDQAKTIINARESVTKAEQDQAETVIRARESVAKAEKDQAKTIKDSRESVVKAEEAAAEKIKSARASLSGGKDGQPPSWLTSDVLTNTLKQFTGELTTAQLKAQGFSDEQIKAIQATSKLAEDAATKVKTLGQVFDIAKETLGSGWSTTFRTIFGDFGEARTTFTALSNTINGFINTNSNARNKVLADWKELGGRTVLIEGIKNVFHDLMAIIKPIGEAFRDIFPAQTGKNLFELTKNFEAFTEKLKPSQTTIDNLQRTFRGLFAVLHIGWTIIKDVVGVFFDLFGVVGKGGGGFLNFTGTIGDLLVALDKALTTGGLLKTFFGGVSAILQVPIKLFGQLAGLIFGLFGGSGDDAKASALSGSLDKVGKAAGPLTPILEALKKAWDGFLHVLGEAKDLAAPWLSNIGDLVSHLGDTLSNALGKIDFNKTLGVLQTGFIGGIFLVLRKAITGGSGKLTGALSSLNEVFEGLTGNLQAMQQKIKAQTILLIASSIGVLAASTYVLSTIDPKRLASALTAMAVGLGELMGAMKLMTSGLGMAGILTLPVLAAGLIGVATATVIIAGAMKLFATMKWEDIAKGLAGVGGGLAAIGLGMKALGPGSLIQGPALIAIAIALNLLALAVKQFSGMKWEDMGRGLAGVFGVLTAMAIPLAAMGPSIALVGPGLIAASIGLNLMARAVSSFGDMDPAKMATGILGIGAALVVLGAAINLIPPTVGLQAAGLIVLSVALVGIAGAIALMGKMKVETIVKGLATLGGALAILAVGLGAMSGTLVGSVALLAAAGALAVLAPTLGFMGTLNWGTIFKGLASMALVLGTLSIVGELASGGLIALGISLLPLAGVFVLAAGGVLLFAKALALLGDSGSKGIGVMIASITAFIALLPTLVISLLKGLLDVVGTIAELAPKIVVALGTILDTIIAFIIANAAKLAVAIGSLIDAGLAVLIENTPKLVTAGAKILLDLLSGIDQNIEQVATRASSIVVKFLTTLTGQAPALTTAGVNFLVSMLNGIAAQIPRLVTSAIGLVVSFIGAVVGQLPKVLTLGVQMVGTFITGILGQVGNIVAAGLKVVLHIITGIGNALPRIVEAAGTVITKFVNAVADVGPKVVDAGFKALIQFLHGIATAIRENNQDLVDAGVDIATAIAQGLVDGLGAIGGRLIKPAIEKLFGALPGWARKILGINSPSKVFMEIGKFSAEGMVVGLQRGTPNVASSATGMGEAAVSAIQNSMKMASDALSVGIDANPTITPVLDLSDVKSGMKFINGISDTPVDATASYGLASHISAETQANAAEQASSSSADSRPVIHYEQNNYSPEALSPSEVYRQTNNQLSQLKGALGFEKK